MSGIKMELYRRYWTNGGLIAGPFWPDGQGAKFTGTIGSGVWSFHGSYDAEGNYLSSSLERQRNPDIDDQLRIVAEYAEPVAVVEPPQVKRPGATWLARSSAHS